MNPITAITINQKVNRYLEQVEAINASLERIAHVLEALLQSRVEEYAATKDGKLLAPEDINDI